MVVGKGVGGYLSQGVQEYLDRLTHYTRLEMAIIPDIKGAKNMSQPQIKEAEGEQIVARFLPSDTVVLLDEGGEQLSSEGLADFLQSTTLRTARRVVFVVGGAYGFSQKVYHRANKKLSLSRMTFSHQMVRLIFLEQLYRAHTIIKGEPYHHS